MDCNTRTYIVKSNQNQEVMSELDKDSRCFMWLITGMEKAAFVKFNSQYVYVDVDRNSLKIEVRV